MANGAQVIELPISVFYVHEGVITNVIMQDASFICDGTIYVEDDGIHGIGDKYNAQTGEFTRQSNPDATGDSE